MHRFRIDWNPSMCQGEAGVPFGDVRIETAVRHARLVWILIEVMVRHCCDRIQIPSKAQKLEGRVEAFTGSRSCSWTIPSQRIMTETPLKTSIAHQKMRSRDRSIRAVYCANCDRKVGHQSGDTLIVSCQCTRVIFCNETCREQAMSLGKHKCPGLFEYVNLKHSNGQAPLLKC